MKLIDDETDRVTVQSTGPAARNRVRHRDGREVRPLQPIQNTLASDGTETGSTPLAIAIWVA